MAPNGPLTEDGLVQLLTPAGRRTAHPDYDARVAHLDADALRGLYRDMVLVRRFDNEATSLQRQGELALFAQASARRPRRSAPAARSRRRTTCSRATASTASRTRAASTWRTCCGCSAASTTAAGTPRSSGSTCTRWSSARTRCTRRATRWACSATAPSARATRTRDSAVVAYFGDGSTSQGDVNEALVFAAVNNAPVVFFCQNNQWAISEPTTQQSRVPLADRGKGFGIPSVRVDGNDVLASYAVTAEALERARSGGGPTFIEAFTYRMGAHTTSDDPSRYRSAAEEEYWRQRDPIDRLRTHLEERGELPAAFVATARRPRPTSWASACAPTVRGMGRPSAASMFEHVYAAPHSVVESERAWFEQYEASFLDASQSGEGSHR